MKQVMPSGVLAASATSPARSPLVTHIFVPLRTYSSPSGVGLAPDRLGVAAGVGLGQAKAARSSPVAIRGSHRAFCSSVPNRSMSVAAIVCVLSTPASDIHPYASSSMSRA